MLKDHHPAYYKTSDGERLFYVTNFALDSYDPNKVLLVFNYGLVCNFAHWSYQIEYFDKAGYQILFHDLRGHFNSSGCNNLEKCSLKQFCSDIEELLDSLNAKNVVMFGHSMGVNITLEYALKRPEVLVGTVLISGTVIPPQGVMFDSNIMEFVTPYLEVLTEKFPKVTDKLWRTVGFNPIAQHMVLKGGFNPEKVSIEFIQTYMNKIGKLGHKLFFKLFKEMHDHDIINHLQQIETPSLVMGGDKDQIIPNYLQNIFQQNLKNCDFYTIKDGSHVPQVDFPESVNQRIDFFLNEITV